MSEKIALEKNKHIVEVYPSEVAGYKKDGWELIDEPQPKVLKKDKEAK